MPVVKVTASRGAGNVCVFDVVDSSGADVDLTALGAAKATVSVCAPGCATVSADSEGELVSFSGNTVSIKFGKLGLPATRNANLPYFPTISYTLLGQAGAEVIAAKGFETEIQLKVVC